jgi:drug/metabolite transporter (DMT)-like permease
MTDEHNQNVSTNRGYLVALLSSAILSTTAIFIRYLTENYQIPALVLAFWRDVFVVLTLLPVFWVINHKRLQIESNQRFFLVVFGFILAVFNAFWTLSVALNGAAIATVLVYSSAGFTALLGWWLLKEELGWVKLVAVCICFLGCVFVSGAFQAKIWQLNLVGVLTGLFSGLSYAVYSLMGRTASVRGLNPWTSLVYTFAWAAVFLFLGNLFLGEVLPGAATTPGDLFWLGSRWSGWVVLFLLAAGPTVAGFGLYNVSLSLLPSSITNLIVTLEPVFTALLAYLLLGEVLTQIQVFGSLLILAGVISLRLPTLRFGSRLTRN